MKKTFKELNKSIAQIAGEVLDIALHLDIPVVTNDKLWKASLIWLQQNKCYVSDVHRLQETVTKELFGEPDDVDMTVKEEAQL